MGYTTPVIKMFIRHKNLKSVLEFNIEITRRGVEIKSLQHFCGLHLHIMWQMMEYILYCGFLSSALFVSEKNMILKTFMCLNL